MVDQTCSIPRATYRLQFHRDFTFDDAVAIAPYLTRLGVSHVYCSPIQRARPGSLHGYDVIARDEVNPELGGEAGYQRFSAALRAHELGQLLDVVPNHMGVGPDNPWWMDVLAHGAASPYADYFEIDWQPLNPDLRGKVLLPVLGDHYGAVLAPSGCRLDGDTLLVRSCCLTLSSRSKHSMRRARTAPNAGRTRCLRPQPTTTSARKMFATHQCVFRNTGRLGVKATFGELGGGHQLLIKGLDGMAVACRSKAEGPRYRKLLGTQRETPAMFEIATLMRRYQIDDAAP